MPGSWALKGGTDGRTNGRTDGRTENLPILQDFVPYRGRCPKSLSASPTGLIEVALRQVDSIGFGQWGSYGNGKFKQEELILEKCMKQVQSSLSSHCILVVILIAVDYGLTLKA